MSTARRVSSCNGWYWLLYFFSSSLSLSFPSCSFLSAPSSNSPRFSGSTPTLPSMPIERGLARHERQEPASNHVTSHSNPLPRYPHPPFPTTLPLLEPDRVFYLINPRSPKSVGAPAKTSEVINHASFSILSCSDPHQWYEHYFAFFLPLLLGLP